MAPRVVGHSGTQSTESKEFADTTRVVHSEHYPRPNHVELDGEHLKAVRTFEAEGGQVDAP